MTLADRNGQVDPSTAKKRWEKQTEKPCRVRVFVRRNVLQIGRIRGNQPEFGQINSVSFAPRLIVSEGELIGAVVAGPQPGPDRVAGGDRGGHRSTVRVYRSSERQTESDASISLPEPWSTRYDVRRKSLQGKDLIELMSNKRLSNIFAGKF